jgi:hypothetical protein
VLKLLPEAGLTLNPDKCKVGDGGDLGSDQGIQNTTDKTWNNVSWDLEDLFSKFISHFLNIIMPLHKLRRPLISVGDQISKCSFLIPRGLSCSSLETQEYGSGGPLSWPSDTLYPQKLALTSPTCCVRLVGLVCSWTKTTEFVFEDWVASSPAHVYFKCDVKTIMVTVITPVGFGSVLIQG